MYTNRFEISTPSRKYQYIYLKLMYYIENSKLLYTHWYHYQGKQENNGEHPLQPLFDSFV